MRPATREDRLDSKNQQRNITQASGTPIAAEQKGTGFATHKDTIGRV